MSAASAIPTPTTLPERAFSLHCQGLRSPDIAQALGIPDQHSRPNRGPSPRGRGGRE